MVMKPSVVKLKSKGLIPLEYIGFSVEIVI